MSANNQKQAALRPKYTVVKSTFKMFKSRVKTISANPEMSQNIHRQKYLNEMERMRDRVHRLLQSYSQYKPEEPSHDSSTGYIPEEILEAMKALSKPPKRFVKATLIKINELIRAIQDDYQFMKNEYKRRRYNELIQFRKQVCCILSHYSMSPPPSEHCFRFAPCSTKLAAIYGVRTDTQNQQTRLELKSRVLEFDFDDDLIELALPTYCRIKETHKFFVNLADRLSNRLNLFKDSLEEKERLMVVLEDVIRRRDYLDALTAEIIRRKKIRSEDEDKQMTSGQEVLGTFDKRFEAFTPFSHYLELPSRKKLRESLVFHDNLLRKIVENKMKVALHDDSSKQQKPTEIKSLEERIRNNIFFIINVLDSYPTPELKPEPESELHRFKPTEKKAVLVTSSLNEDGHASKSYEFDDKTNDLAFPKLTILLSAEQKHKEMLKKFIDDTRNAHAIAQPDKEEFDEVAGRDHGGATRKTPSERQKNKAREEKAVERAKKQHEDLVTRTNRLVSLIQEQLDRIEMLQSPGTEGRSDYYHHMVCSADQKIDPFKDYEMAKPHQSICTSLATKNRLIESLKIYREWLAQRKADVRYKNQIEKILARVKEEKFDGTEKRAGTLESTEKPSRHTMHLIHNMETLEETLKNYPEVDAAFHTMSHKKFDDEPLERLQGVFDEHHATAMAKPKKVHLKNTLQSFGKLMSPEKQQRIECQLGGPIESEDHQKQKRSTKQKTGREEIQLLQQIEKKIAGDLYDEIAKMLQKKLPEMIVNRKSPLMTTSNGQKLQDHAFNMLTSFNGPAKDPEELQQMQNFAGLIGDFAMATMVGAMDLAPKHELRTTKPLKTVEKNRDLLKIADDLMKKLKQKPQ